jgi:hypothetical protein
MHTPGTVQVTPGTPATVALDMATIPPNTPMPGNAFLSCLLPTTFMRPYCSFNSPGGLKGLYQGYTKAAITLTIFTSGVASSSISPLPAGKLGVVPPLPEWTYLSVLLSLAALGLVTKERVRFRKIQVSATLALLVIVATGLLSCGGGSGTPASTPVSSATSPTSPSPPAPPSQPPAPGLSTVTVTATVPTLSGNVSKSLTISINVN